MSRAQFDVAFTRLAAELLPPGLEIKDFSGVKLHPLIHPITIDEKGNTVGGGFDNEKTIFGIIVPTASGKTLVVQVSDASEKALSQDGLPTVLKHLRADIKAALALWDSRAVPHEHALLNVVRL